MALRHLIDQAIDQAMREEQQEMSQVRSGPLRPETVYAHGGSTAAEIAGAVVWLALWFLNGAMTIALALSLGLPWWLGAGGHVVISVVEQHGRRSQRWSMRLLILLFGFVDVLSSALGIQAFLTTRGAPSGADTWLAAVVYTVLAEFIAIAPEPFLVGHLFALWRLMLRR